MKNQGPSQDQYYWIAVNYCSMLPNIYTWKTIRIIQ